MRRAPRLFVSVALLAAASVSPLAQQHPSAPLRIVVVSGEDAVNIIQQKTAVAPVVEVRDRNNQPVAGAIVTFTIQGGGNATFAGASTVTATTNALGQAAVTSLTPTGAGAVQINVAAAFQGQTATAAITQTNFATAAQAAAASSSASSGSSGAAAGGSGGGGGGIGAGTITAITVGAAGAVGGLYAYRKYEMGEAPAMTGLRVFPPSGLAMITPIDASAGETTWHGDGASLSTDYGDGTVVTEMMPMMSDPLQRGHVYQASGTYTIRVTITDAWDRTASQQASVTIKNLTGRWNVGNTGSYFTLTQDGATLGGTFTSTNAQSCGSLSGSVRRQSAGNVTFTVTAPCPEFNSTFSGMSTFDNPDLITGTLTTGNRSSNVQLIRQ